MAESPHLQGVRTIAEIEAKFHAQRSMVDRLSDLISRFAGNAWFVVIHIIAFGGWIVWNENSAAPVDEYPYKFLTLLASLEAIFLTSFVMISQHHSERQSRRRAALDLQINLLAEREMTIVLSTVRAIAQHLRVETLLSDSEAEALANETDIASLVDALDAADPLTPDRPTDPSK